MSSKISSLSREQKLALIEKLEGRLQKRMQLQEQYDTEAANLDFTSDSNLENFRAGIGRGMVNVGRNVGNIVGLVSDEDIEEARQRDRSLLETKAGLGGSILGEVAALAPVGGAVSGGLARSARLAGAVRTPMRRAATEGALYGGILSDPGERLQGAALSGALTGGISGVGQGLKKAVKGLVPPNKAAQEMMEHHVGVPTGDDFIIPISQSGKEGSLVRLIYSGLLANMPGIGGRLRNQYKKAVQEFREQVGEESLPTWADRPFDIDASAQEIVTGVSNWWKNQLKHLADSKSNFWFTKSWKPDEKVVKKLSAFLPKGTPEKLLSGEKLNAGEVFMIRKALFKALRRNPDDKAVDDFLRYFDNHLDSTMGRHYLTRQHWDEIKGLEEPYEVFRDMMGAAVRQAGNKEFLPKQLADVAGKRAMAIGGAGATAPIQGFANLGAEALVPFPSNAGIFQTVAALGLLGYGGITDDFTTPAGIFATGLALSDPRMQRALMGRTKTQAEIAKLLRKYKDQIEAASQFGRAAVASGVNQ